MKIKEYFERLDATILLDTKALLGQIVNLGVVLIICPMHISILAIRIAFPWFNPFIEKFMEKYLDN
tara:strand:- start:856 stop:1053 length:198 start_codon:yes stop_codon:yes gene_type:complete